MQTLPPVTALANTAAADNLLVLSLDAKKLIESKRDGSLLGSFNLASITGQAIEGVTVDDRGTIYLVAESFDLDDVPGSTSKLFVLSPVLEPQTYALLLAGLAGLATLARRRG